MRLQSYRSAGGAPLGLIPFGAAFKHRGRFDWALLGLMTGAISLFLYVAYVTDPSCAAGGT